VAQLRKRRPLSGVSAKGMTFESVRRFALALPGVLEDTCYGTPAFRVKGKLLARLKEDGETLVIRMDYDSRAALMEANPETYFVTDHYAGHEWMLVRLPTVRAAEMQELLTNAWQRRKGNARRS
jgi:hypothetical protein